MDWLNQLVTIDEKKIKNVITTSKRQSLVVGKTGVLVYKLKVNTKKVTFSKLIKTKNWNLTDGYILP